MGLERRKLWPISRTCQANSIPAEVQTRYLLNTSKGNYCYPNLLHKSYLQKKYVRMKG
jgi:hypothetical protein